MCRSRSGVALIVLQRGSPPKERIARQRLRHEPHAPKVRSLLIPRDRMTWLQAAVASKPDTFGHRRRGLGRRCRSTIRLHLPLTHCSSASSG